MFECVLVCRNFHPVKLGYNDHAALLVTTRSNWTEVKNNQLFSKVLPTKKYLFTHTHIHTHTHAHTEKHSLSNDIKIDYMLIFAYPYFHVHNIAHSNQSESLVV